MAGPPPIKREATGGWLAPVLFIFSTVILLLGGLWYYFAPQIASARRQVAQVATQSPKRPPVRAVADAQPKAASSRTVIEEVKPTATPVSPAPTPTATPEVTPASSPTASPNPAAIAAGTQALKSVFGGLLSSGDTPKAATPTKAASASKSPAAKPPRETPVPSVEAEKQLAMALREPATEPKRTPGRSITLSEESFATGRPTISGGAAPPAPRRESDRYSSFFVEPSPGAASKQAKAPQGTSSVTALTEQTFSSFVNQSGYPVVVDFWAPWCGPCRRFSPVVEGVAGELAGRVLFAKVNVDENQALARRFGVTSLPTVIVFRNGTIYKRSSGSMTAEALKSWASASR